MINDIIHLLTEVKMIKYIKKYVYILMVIILAFFLESSGNVRSTKIENTKINRTINLSTMALKIEEEEQSRLYSAKDSYTGDLTGYAFNCPLCSGRLACLSSYDITNGTIYYPDETYGSVRIVASSLNLPCGTIIRFNSSRISEDPVMAIVLDRGVTGNSIDLLSPSEDYALSHIGRSTIYYEVLRSGW